MNGEQLRDQGLSKVEANAKEWIKQARAEAVDIATRKGSVTVNDVRDVMELPKGVHPSAWSAVMRTKKLRVCGFSRAAHPEAHGRFINRYEVVEGNL